MQSWGIQSRFDYRDTLRYPSKSGVIGMICSALGRSRTEPLDDLIGLKMTVRIDHAGVYGVDYQTAGGGEFNGKEYCVINSDGKYDKKRNAITSYRYYLADAEFHVALEGNSDTINMIKNALHNPKWFLCLGRKAFVPTLPIYQGVHEKDALEVFKEIPWKPKHSGQELPEKLQVIIECGYNEGDSFLTDVPISFDYDKRKYSIRYIKHDYIDNPNFAKDEKNEYTFDEINA